MTILIVEDEDGIQIVWKHFLRDLPTEVVTVKTFKAALAVMDKIPSPDLILLDLHLLDSAAEQTLNGIKEFKKRNPNAVVLVLTGDTNQKLRQAANALGADFFATKLEVDTQVKLYNAISTAITHPNTNREAPPFEEGLKLVEMITDLCVKHSQRQAIA